MPRILIENLFKTVIYVTDESKTLLRHLHDQGIDWMHACGGKGRCTTCKAIVKEGNEHVAPLTQAELKYLRDGALGSGERLACQARIVGDVTIIAPPEYHLPHLRYSDDT